MGLLEELNKFSINNDKFSYTFLIHSTNNSDLIELLKNKLENINKKINNSFKKKFINERMYNLICKLESTFKLTDEINHIFLVDSEIHQFELSKSERSFCSKWNISKFFMEHDDHFHINYLDELLSTKMIQTVFKFDKNSYQVVEIDNTKSRVVESHSSLDDTSINTMISKHKPTILYGVNSSLKKFSGPDDIEICHKNITNEEVMEIIRVKNIQHNQNKFKEEFLDNIGNPNVEDKLLFGKKEVGIAIQNYMVKKLFINQKLYNILKQKVEPSVLNFEINVIQSLETGDYGYTLNKNYDGMVAIKYY